AIITSLRQWRRRLPRELRRYASNLDFPIQVALPSLATIENFKGDAHVKSSYSRILRHCIGTTVLLSAYLAVPGLAQQSGGQTAQGSDKFLDFFRRTELSGFVDVYYGYNFNTPATRKAGPERTFDVQHNSFSLNLAELSLEKKPTDDSRGGFRVDLDYGPHPVF